MGPTLHPCPLLQPPDPMSSSYESSLVYTAIPFLCHHHGQTNLVTQKKQKQAGRGNSKKGASHPLGGPQGDTQLLQGWGGVGTVSRGPRNSAATAASQSWLLSLCTCSGAGREGSHGLEQEAAHSLPAGGSTRAITAMPSLPETIREQTEPAPRSGRM